MKGQPARPNRSHGEAKYMTRSQAKHSVLYLRFLNLVQAIQDLPGFTPMDPVEERLFNTFATAWHAGRQITVLEAMGMLSDISSTTAHRRLKTLRGKGWITFQVDESDGRIKYVVPTDQANQYFAQLGECIDKARTK
jgi:hypothetical protein